MSISQRDIIPSIIYAPFVDCVKQHHNDIDQKYRLKAPTKHLHEHNKKSCPYLDPVSTIDL